MYKSYRFDFIFIFLTIIAISGYIYYLYSINENKKEDKTKMINKLYDEAKTNYSKELQLYIVSIHKYYNKSFSLTEIEKTKWDWEPQNLKFKFTNYSKQTIEAIKLNIIIKTKLNTTLFVYNNVEITQNIKPYNSITFSLPAKKRLSHYNLSQLKIVFSIPNEKEYLETNYAIKNNLPIAGKNPFIIFADGYEIHQINLREGYMFPGIRKEKQIDLYTQKANEISILRRKYFD